MARTFAFRDTTAGGEPGELTVRRWARFAGGPDVLAEPGTRPPP